VGDREVVPLAAVLLAADHQVAALLAAVLLVAHRLHLEAAVFRLHLEAAVLLVTIAPEGLIPFPTAVLPTDTRLDTRLGTVVVALALALLALAQGMVSGSP